MLAVLTVVAPIFALVLAGWGARRAKVFGPQTCGELSRFVVNLALPALLFDVTANAHWREIWLPGFIAAFGLGMFAVFVLTVILRRRAKRPLADASVEGLNAAYANTGFMGFPLALAALGPAAMAPTLISAILTVCVLFGVALVVIETGIQTERRPLLMIGKVTASLARNPLLIAPVLGAAVMASGLGVPAPVESFIKLLGAAASPCALVSLGLFLGERRAKAERAPVGATALLVGLKLLAQPALTWVLATQVFHLSGPMTRAAVLLAALPTGTGAFMAAEYYRRDAALTAQVVLVSTVLSLATITLYLAVSG